MAFDINFINSFNDKRREHLNSLCVTLVSRHKEALAKIPSWHLLRMAIGTAVNVDGNRGILTEHIYNVKSVSFCDSKGKRINTDNVDELKSKIDVKRSKVVIQNPHGNHNPYFDPQGDIQNASNPFGTDFEMTLEEYMHSTDMMAFSRIRVK